MTNTLTEYVLDRKNQRAGLVVATLDKYGNVTIGWSKLNKSAGDKFNRDMALRIAIHRALSGSNTAVPNAIQPSIDKMRSRAKRYFKMSPAKYIGVSFRKIFNLPISEK